MKKAAVPGFQNFERKQPDKKPTRADNSTVYILKSII